MCFPDETLIMATRGEWSKLFLLRLGNANPDQKTINFVSAWTKAENTEARYNPLATTLDYGTNTKFNTANVRNYTSREAGIEASVMTLNGNHAGYAELKKALLVNDGNAALLSGGLDTWGSGSAHVGAIWRTSDTTNEPLKSESGRDTNPTVIKPDIPNPLGPEASTTAPGGYSGVVIPESGVTGDSVKKYLKISLGSLFAVAGIVVLIMAVSKSDSVKTAVDIAKVAAI